MSDKKIKRVDPNDAPVGVFMESYNRAADDYNKNSRPRYPAEMDYQGHKAGREADKEWAREANRAQTMQGVNYPDTVKKKKGGMIKATASKRADGCAQRGKTRGKMI